MAQGHHRSTERYPRLDYRLCKKDSQQAQMKPLTADTERTGGLWLAKGETGSGEDACLTEELFVVAGFVLERQGVGPRGGGQAMEGEPATGDGELDALAYPGHGDAVVVADYLARFLARAGNMAAKGNLIEQTGQVGVLLHLKEFVGSISLQTDHATGGIEDSNTLVAEQLLDGLLMETLMLRIHKMEGIAKEYMSEDLPHHIGTVGIEEIHAPTVAWRREAAEQKQPRPGWQKGLKRMAFYRVGRGGHNGRTVYGEWTEEGLAKQMEDGDAEVVAYHVAQEADADAQHYDIAVLEHGSHHGHEGRGIDEGYATYHDAVAVDLEEPGKEELQHQGAEDDIGYVVDDGDILAQLHLGDIDLGGYGQAEDIDAIKTHVEGLRLSLDRLDEGGSDGKGGQEEDEQGHVGFLAARGQEADAIADGCDKEGGSDEKEAAFAHAPREGTARMFGGRLFEFPGGDGGVGREVCGSAQKASEEGFAEEDDEHEVEAGNDEVATGDEDVEAVGHADGLGYGSDVGDAASIDARGDGADLGVVLVGEAALAPEDEIAAHDDDHHREQSGKEDLERLAYLPPLERTGHEHERNGQRDGQRGDGGTQAGVALGEETAVADHDAYEIEHGHRTYLADPAPALGQAHYGPGNEEQIEEGEKLGDHHWRVAGLEIRLRLGLASDAASSFAAAAFLWGVR